MSIIIVIILKYYYTFKVLLKTGCFLGINCGGALKTQPLENRAALRAELLKAHNNYFHTAEKIKKAE